MGKIDWQCIYVKTSIYIIIMFFIKSVLMLNQNIFFLLWIKTIAWVLGFFFSFLIPDSLRQRRNSEAPSAERKKSVSRRKSTVFLQTKKHWFQNKLYILNILFKKCSAITIRAISSVLVPSKIRYLHATKTSITPACFQV